MHGETVKPVS